MATSRDPDLYVNDDLGFELRKPSHWTFLPTPWAANLRKRAALSNEELREVMEHAKTPFVYAHLEHTRTDAAFPTLQAGCRALGEPLDPEVVLHQITAQLARQFAEHEVLEQTANALVGGCRTIMLSHRFTLRNADGDQFRCLSRSYTLFSHRLVFSVGLTCAASGDYCVEEDLELIARSIRVRRR